MKKLLFTQLTSHLVGFLLSLILLAALYLLGLGALATILYWGNFEGMRANVSLGEIWSQVVSPNSILAFIKKVYPWGLLFWLGGGVMAGWSSTAQFGERTQRVALCAVGIMTGLGVTVAMNGASLGPSVIMTITVYALGTALTMPAFFMAVALSRGLPKFYEWLRDTEVETLFRR